MAGRKKFTKEQYINKANEDHDNKYDYSDTVYTGSHDIIKIKCKLHGEFEQLANSHLTGRGCSKCGYKLSSSKQSCTKEKFIIRANKVHKFKYGYDDTKYINSKTKVKIRCFYHGVFEQMPYNHLSGQGCKQCYILNRFY